MTICSYIFHVFTQKSHFFCGKYGRAKGLCRGEEGDKGGVASDPSQLVGGLITPISEIGKW